jgi:stalled ribosome alternative rescue factor ArfA
LNGLGSIAALENCDSGDHSDSPPRNNFEHNLLELLDSLNDGPQNDEKKLINELVKGAKDDASRRRKGLIQKAHKKRVEEIHTRKPCLKHLQRGLKHSHHRREYEDVDLRPKGKGSYKREVPKAKAVWEDSPRDEILKRHPSATLHRKIDSVDSIMQSRNPNSDLATLLLECVPIQDNAKRSVKSIQKLKHDFVRQEMEWDEARQGRTIVASKLFRKKTHI